jgi:hypothetical protein
MSLLQDRLKKKGIVTPTKSKLGGLASKFQKRDKGVLEKTYESREDRSKAGGMGKSIFEQEILEEFGIKEFQFSTGDHFIEILPISFAPEIPYFRETNVHFGVGFAQDSFICNHRFLGQPCYRCEVQQKLFRVNKTVTDEIKRLYPSDRIIYLVWERTKELLEEEPPDYTLQIWNAPKTKVHAEIQLKVRDKIKRTTLDISDVTTDEGRTVGFTIVKQGDFPAYKGFELHPRTEPIPEEILEQLELIIETAAERGYLKYSLDMFLNIPDYSEVKESMLTEQQVAEDEEKGSDDEETPKKFPRQQLNKPAEEESNVKTVEDTEKEILEYLEGLQEELNEMGSFGFNKWCRENDYGEAIGMDKGEAIEAIIEDLYTKMMQESDIQY